MTAKDYKLINYVNDQDSIFVIPHYQRKYVWEVKKEIKELLQDIKDFINDDKNEFILGAIITKLVRKNQLNEILLVDGQQRITTFLIIISALLHANKENEELEDAKDLNSQLINILKTSASDKFKLERIEDEYIIKHILNGNYGSIFSKYENSNYVKCFYFFMKEFSKWNFEELKNFFTKGLSKIKVAVIELDLQDDENLVFEAFNSKGKSLTSYELIKNYLISTLEKNKFSNEFVKDFENNFLERFEGKSIEDFWRQYLALEKGALFSKSGKAMYLEFKNTFPENSINKEFIDNINKHKVIWDFLCNKKIQNDRKQTKTKDRILYNANLLSFYTIVHAIIYRTSKIENNRIIFLNERSTNYAISFVSRLIVGRTLCSFGRVEGNREFAKLGHDLFMSNNDFNQDFKEFVEEKLIYSTKKYRMPSWDEISNIDSKNDLYTDHRASLKWVFASIEENISKVERSIEEIEKLEIEHIFPQNPKQKDLEEWKVKITDEEWTNWLNTLGNLSLIESPANKKLGNLSYEEKMELLKNHSYLKINKEIYEYREWGLEQLKSRAKKMLEYIKNIWEFN